ncbi:MAG TPA: HipA domain-containing protein [Propionibacteriaceae bacterium]
MTARDPRRVRRAEVYKAGRPAATLTRNDLGVSFAYEPGYDGPPVAHTLPVGARVDVVGSGLPAFFAGLLPEGRRLNALRRSVKTSADDDLSLLLAIGEDTVGDVAVVPEGQEPVSVTPWVSSLEDLAGLDFSDLLAEAGFVDHVGLAGVQDKVSTGMVTLPLAVGASAGIIKLDPPDYPDAVVNESYFLSLARRLKLPVVGSTLVHDRNGRPGLLVARFDRLAEPGGKMRRLAVEDAGQLLGRYPADKYNVTSEEVTGAAAAACQASAVAVRSCFQQFTFAWLTGNGDLHAKNLSVLMDEHGEWRMAPLYDIPSTLPYGDLSAALTLHGATQGLTRKRFLQFADTIGLPARAAESALEDVLRSTEPMLGELSDGRLPWNDNLRKSIVRQLTRRRTDLLAS